MTKIGTFINHPGGNFSDNSVTIAAQTNTQNNAVPSPQSEAPQEEGYKPFRLNPTIDKIELLRVINAMCEYGFFYKTDIDKKADKKDVFAAFAQMLGDPRIAKFSTDLNRAKDPYSDPKVNTRIFDALRDKSKEYFAK